MQKKSSISYLADSVCRSGTTKRIVRIIKICAVFLQYSAKKRGRVKHRRYPDDIMDSNVNIGNIRQSYDRVSTSRERRALPRT